MARRSPGPDATNAVVGVWSTTERRKLKVSGTAEARPRVQVSRLGNPLVNEVVIPLGKKDQFNRTTPDQDAKLYGKYVVKPELATVLNALFDIGAPRTTARTSCRRCSRASRASTSTSGLAAAGRRHDQAQPRRAAG